jgi:hypothetical protein
VSPIGELTASRENGHRRPKGYAPWRPQRETRTLLEAVGRVLDEYAEQLPLTVRQIFYRLVGVGAIDKTERAYERLGNHLVRARRARLLPFAAIRDDGIVTLRHEYYDGVEDFHDETGRRAKRYRRDRQTGQPVRLELWCEAAGMVHQLDRIASRYSVPVYSTSGFASLTATYDIARRALERNVPTVLLHVGDYDPSGESIFETIAQDAAAFVHADRTLATIRLDAVRVALTAGQVDRHELATTPAKASDSRSHCWNGETCQLEALAPDLLAETIEAALVDHLDRGALDAQRELERRERAELLALPRGRDDDARGWTQ